MGTEGALKTQAKCSTSIAGTRLVECMVPNSIAGLHKRSPTHVKRDRCLDSTVYRSSCAEHNQQAAGGCYITKIVQPYYGGFIMEYYKILRNITAISLVNFFDLGIFFMKLLNITQIMVTET